MTVLHFCPFSKMLTWLGYFYLSIVDTMPPPKSAGRGDGQPVPVQSSSEQEQNEVSEEENKTDDEQIESSEASGFCFMFT